MTDRTRRDRNRARRRDGLRLMGLIMLFSALGGACYGAVLALGAGQGAFWPNIAQGTLSGLLISGWCSAIDIFVLSDPNSRLRSLAFAPFVALRAFSYAVGIGLGLRIPLVLGGAPVSEVLRIYDDPVSVQIFIVSLAIAFFVALIIEISRLLGPGVLPALLTGRYHQPRREARVFLLADLEGSTALAERIGDLEFHRFLSAVWADCAEPIRRRRGQTYRYVGDEIIVSWPLARGVKRARCLRCAREMQEALEDRAAWYRAQFGAAPRFRAALHCGDVVTGEMGDQRTEIVFLGDTVNTASRLLSECRVRGEELLLSGALADLLPEVEALPLRPLGEWLPRGKSRPIRVFGAGPAAPPAG